MEKDGTWAEPVLGGLTPFGREVVREMNRVGMIIDISHVHEVTMNAGGPTHTCTHAHTYIHTHMNRVGMIIDISNVHEVTMNAGVPTYTHSTLYTTPHHTAQPHHTTPHSHSSSMAMCANRTPHTTHNTPHSLGHH